MTKTQELMKWLKENPLNENMIDNVNEHDSGIIVYSYNGFVGCALYVTEDDRVLDFSDINENLEFCPETLIATKTEGSRFDPMTSLTRFDSVNDYKNWFNKIMNPEYVG